MYVVTVTFRVNPEHIDVFMYAMVQQAKNSLVREPDCHVFDVCLDADDPQRVFLYEKYASKDAFNAHLAGDHFRAFDAQVAPWVIEKQVESWILQGPVS